MENRYQVIYLDSVTTFFRGLSPKDRSKIEGDIKVMLSGDLHSPRIKTLRGSVKELIVKEYRILFFIHEHIIYFVRTFRRKSAKTPLKEIKYAECIYKLTTNP